MEAHHLVDSTPEQALLNAFLGGRNKSTWEAYRNDLESFASFLGSDSIRTGVGKFIQLASGEANRQVLLYRTSLTEKGLRPSTVNRRLAAIRSLVKLGRTIGVISWSIEITNLKNEVYRDTRGPGQVAFQAMIGQVRGQQTPKQCRDYAILRLLYDLALRASEVTALDSDDIDLNQGIITVLGKGKSQKVRLTLPQETQQALSQWLKVRQPGREAFFYNFDRAAKGSRLTRAGLYQIVRKIGENINIRTRPHGIRHTSITQAIKVAQLNGILLPEVKQFSRHASLATLQIYADRERDIAGKLAELVSQSAT